MRGLFMLERESGRGNLMRSAAALSLNGKSGEGRHSRRVQQHVLDYRCRPARLGLSVARTSHDLEKFFLAESRNRDHIIEANLECEIRKSWRLLLLLVSCFALCTALILHRDSCTTSSSAKSQRPSASTFKGAKGLSALEY
jgi:hypothetical protein